MAASATAAWLDSFFAGYDHFFLNILHVLGDKAGAVLTPLMRVITFLGEKGIVFFLLALVFMLMADKRDLGVCIFGAVCCGALITNIILKDSVGRLRPFEMVPEYQQWWVAIGAPAEDGCSFPSGHVTACAAGMTAITLMRGKKWILPSVLIVFFMGVSRNSLMAHYPSDVLFAAIIGVFSGVVSWLITQLIFRFLRRKRRSSPLCAAILDFDIRDVLPLPASLGGNGGKRAAKPVRAAAPARRAARPVRAAAEEEPEDDVKTYSGSGRHAKPAAAGRSPLFEKTSPRRTNGEAALDGPAPRRVRRETEPAQTDVRAESVPEEAASEEAAPRRTRAGGSHSAPARTASGAGGRHILGGAKESAPRASRSSAKGRAPGGYQGKHVK